MALWMAGPSVQIGPLRVFAGIRFGLVCHIPYVVRKVRVRTKIRTTDRTRLGFSVQLGRSWHELFDYLDSISISACFFEITSLEIINL